MWIYFMYINLLGGVPIATLNLQAGVVDTEHIPDSWHHQMIFGVGPRGIYMTNPVDRIEEGTLWHQLCSDSVISFIIVVV